MSKRARGTLLPILVGFLALIAVASAGAPAAAADADLHAQGGSFALGQADLPSSQAEQTRIYVPLHPAKPAEVGKEFAPIQATPFGGALAGGTPARAAAASKASAGKPPMTGNAAVPAKPRTGIELPESEWGGLY